MQETPEILVRFLGWEDPLEEGMATHSSILVWRITWTEEPGGLQSIGCKESDTTEVTEHNIRVAEQYDIPIYIFLSKLYTIFQSSYTILQSHPQFIRVPKKP